MINTIMLKQIIVDNGMSMEKAGILADMCSSSIRKKMSGIVAWSISDIINLRPILHLTDMQIIDIWFC